MCCVHSHSLKSMKSVYFMCILCMSIWKTISSLYFLCVLCIPISKTLNYVHFYNEQYLKYLGPQPKMFGIFRFRASSPSSNAIYMGAHARNPHAASLAGYISMPISNKESIPKPGPSREAGRQGIYTYIKREIQREREREKHTRKENCKQYGEKQLLFKKFRIPAKNNWNI